MLTFFLYLVSMVGVVLLLVAMGCVVAAAVEMVRQVRAERARRQLLLQQRASEARIQQATFAALSQMYGVVRQATQSPGQGD